MLSMTPLKDAGAAKSYYEKDNYYAKDSKEAQSLTTWWGKGAQKLGLTGYVKIDQFEKLLDGVLPNGETLGRTTAKGKKHRPGYDLTFSAPKSVSILAEIGQGSKIHEVHDKAVREALSYLQENAIQTRAFRNGEVIFEQVNNIAVAMFRHDTSRELDPATHTHCIVLNMVQRDDRKWRSISSEALFDHKMVAGTIYRSVLANELQAIGYEIEKTHSDGRFEIKGISKEVLKHFSQRRQKIEARLEKEGWEGAKASAKVTLDTRSKKKEVDREDLHGKWLNRCNEIGFKISAVIDNAKNKTFNNPEKLINTKNIAKEAVIYSIAHLGEREAVFPEKDIIREALAYRIGSTTLMDVKGAIKSLAKKGDLIERGNGLWTTLAALKLESENIQLLKELQNSVASLSTVETISTFISDKQKEYGYEYTKGQQSAIQLILNTNDKVVGIQGNAGSGKTTLLKAVRDFTATIEYELIGISPSKQAAQEITNKAAIFSMTLQKFLIEHNKQKEVQGKNKIIILDESSMVSSRQMNQLLKIIKHSEYRLVMIGDIKQLSAVDAGKPFYQLIKSDMSVAYMTETKRQKSRLLQEAVNDAIERNISESFKKLQVTEIKAKPERFKRIVEEYLTFSPEGRERTMVLVPANEDRTIVNAMIRERLKEEGSLSEEEIKTLTLTSRGLTRIAKLKAGNYQVGDIVRFNKTYKHAQIKAGDYFVVISINQAANELVLEHAVSKRTFTWNPEKLGGRREGAIEIYSPEERALATGDRIRWLRNSGEDIINAQTADVLKVENGIAEVRLHNKKIISLNLHNYSNKHWDYAFAYTVHAKQGGENVRVVAHMESFRKRLTTQQAFYTTITRAEYEVRLIVDSREDCIKTIEKYTGAKTSALEVAENNQESPNLKVDNSNPFKSENSNLNSSTEFNTSSKKPLSYNRWDSYDLQSKLAANVEPFIKQLLGEPNGRLSSSKDLRYGKKGSLWIPIEGQYAGAWHNFETGEKGNLIQLIGHIKGTDFRASLEYAAHYLGISPGQEINIAAHSSYSSNEIRAPLVKELSKEDIKAIERAKRLEALSLPIEGTVAERYLREHRAIKGNIPACFRYLPKARYYEFNDELGKNQVKTFPALVAVAKDVAGETRAVQIVYLDATTANKASIDLAKRTYGRPSYGAAVTINPGQAKVLLAEGPETGLSIAQAFPDATIMVALSASNFSNIKLQPFQKELVICMDNDGADAPSNKAVLSAASKYVKEGRNVHLAMPKEIKQDFNDVLKNQGVEVIRQSIEKANLFDNSVEFPSNSPKYQLEEINRWIDSKSLLNEASKTLNNLEEIKFSQSIDRDLAKFGLNEVKGLNLDNIRVKDDTLGIKKYRDVYIDL